MARGFHEPVEKPRRFYKAVETAADDSGVVVLLDGRALKTPGGVSLRLPTEALARQVAEEWAVQGETIEIAGMLFSTVDWLAKANAAKTYPYAGVWLREDKRVRCSVGG